jgi:hypothetical protein
MNPTIIIYVNTLLGIGVIVSLWLNVRNNKKLEAVIESLPGYGHNIKMEKSGIAWTDTTKHNRDLYEMIFVLRETLHADDVFIARFHNQGCWNNELPIRRFSVVTESYIEGRTYQLQDTMRDVLLSKYPYAMQSLVLLGSYNCPDIIMSEDRKFKKDMVDFGVKSLYLFLIRQITPDKAPEGFIGITFTKERVLTKEEKDIVKGLHDDILGLLNMTRLEHKQS